MQSQFKNPSIRIRRFVLRTFISKEEGKEKWFVQSRKQGALRTFEGKKQRLRCVPVSRLGSPRTWLDFSRGRRELRRDGRSPFGFDIVLDNPYSSVLKYSLGRVPLSTLLLRRLLRVSSRDDFRDVSWNHEISLSKIAYRENAIKLAYDLGNGNENLRQSNCSFSLVLIMTGRKIHYCYLCFQKIEAELNFR